MKKIILITLLAVMLFTAGCSKPTSKLTPEEMTTLYSTAIEQARADEENKSMPVITKPTDDMADMVFPMIGFNPEDAVAYSMSISPWNISAYGIAIITPKEDKKQVVLDGVNTFVANQRKAFENYLPDPYKIAQDAVVSTLDDGTVILVMCEKQDDVMESITKSLTGK